MNGDDEERFVLSPRALKGVLGAYEEILAALEGPPDLQGRRQAMTAAALVFVTREDGDAGTDAGVLYAAALGLAVMVGLEVGL